MSRRRRPWISALLILALPVGSLLWRAPSRLSEYRSFPSPDGDYKVVVYGRSWRAKMPGQGGDAPGVARLLDAEGQVLEEIEVPMVQLVQHVEWLPREVELRRVVRWSLPQSKP